jgi:hypothetical protein
VQATLCSAPEKGVRSTLDSCCCITSFEFWIASFSQFLTRLLRQKSTVTSRIPSFSSSRNPLCLKRPLTKLYSVERNVRAEIAQLPKKMDEVKLSMFNKVYDTFLSNPVKINKKLHVSIRDNGALENTGQGMVRLRCHSMDCTGPR